jgi:hypothetical protein
MGWLILFVNFLIAVFYSALMAQLLWVMKQKKGLHELKIAVCGLIVGAGALGMKVDIRFWPVVLIGLIGLTYAIWQVDMINQPILGLFGKIQEKIGREIIRRVANAIFGFVAMLYIVAAIMLPYIEATKWIGIAMMISLWFIALGVLSGVFNFLRSKLRL